ncbi:putative DNA-3-methyladenine glycosylase I [Helianthus debilis subsp. tardiflorus]
MSDSPVNSVTDCDVSESESRPVLGPAGNKTRSVAELRKPVVKPKTCCKPVGKPEEVVKKSPSPVTVAVNLRRKDSKSITPVPILRHKDCKVLRSNLPMNASCSSDASSDSSHSRVSVGRISRRSVTPVRGKQSGGLKTGENDLKIGAKIGKCVSGSRGGKVESVGVESDGCLEALDDGSPGRKRCAWITANTDPSYAAFHDEEWGVPVHEDKKLFELLSLSTALAEHTWPTILNKRHLFREVFHGFDPVTVSKLNDKKISAPGNPATSLLSEVKLRGIIENARQVCKIVDEFGSFDKYIWGFINHKPIVNKFRYPRQVPIKTSKADSISKDLVKRGFRGVGPTVVYSFLQVAGLTNDHLVSCFRFNECVDAGPTKDVSDDSGQNGRFENGNGLGVTSVIDELRLSGE